VTLAEKGGDEREWKEEKIGRRKYTQSRENEAQFVAAS